MPLNPEWLIRGNFIDVAATRPSIMEEVREALGKRLGRRGSKLRIFYFPPRATFRHCYWWREGRENYIEAQFVAELSRSHAVLSLGVSVEKGREEAGAPAARQSKATMNRRTWDWDRFVKNLPEVLGADLPAVAKKLSSTIQLRVRSRRQGRNASSAWELRAFSLANNHWFQRHHGPTDVDRICEYIRKLDKQQDTWVIVHCVRDCFPAEVEKLTASDVAGILVAFNGVRQRVRQRTARRP